MLYASSGRGHFLGLPRARRTGEFKFVVGCVVTGYRSVGSTATGGKVNWPAGILLFPSRDDWCIRLGGVRQDSGDVGAVEGVVT